MGRRSSARSSSHPSSSRIDRGAAGKREDFLPDVAALSAVSGRGVERSGESLLVSMCIPHTGVGLGKPDARTLTA